jgi:aminoglycoside phosphotransferase (APT) family kinase protein
MLLLPYPALEQIVQRIQAGNTLTHAENLVGGAAAHVVLLHVEDGHAEARRYLLRMHGEADRTRNPHVASHEHRLLTVLHDSGLPVAKPYYLDESGELLPLPYIVVGYLEGATDFTPRNLADFLQQSAGLLARIHRLPALPKLGFLPDRHAHVRRWIAHEPAGLDETLAEGPLRATLRAAFPPPAGQPCHPAPWRFLAGQPHLAGRPARRCRRLGGRRDRRSPV